MALMARAHDRGRGVSARARVPAAPVGRAAAPVRDAAIDRARSFGALGLGLRGGARRRVRRSSRASRRTSSPSPTCSTSARAIAIVGIVAVGETIVIISGGFDLSVGSMMAAAGMLVGLPARARAGRCRSPFAPRSLLGALDRRGQRLDRHRYVPHQPADRDARDARHRARARLRRLGRPGDRRQRRGLARPRHRRRSWHRCR